MSRQLENGVVRECFQACAHRRLQVLEPRHWNPQNPPPFQAEDPAIAGIVWRANTGAARFGVNQERLVRYGLPGQPDVLFMLRGGRFGGFEAKIPQGKVRVYQRWYSSFFGGLGMLYAVVRSYQDTLDALDDWGIK